MWNILLFPVCLVECIIISSVSCEMYYCFQYGQLKCFIVSNMVDHVQKYIIVSRMINWNLLLFPVHSGGMACRVLHIRCNLPGWSRPVLYPRWWRDPAVGPGLHDSGYADWARRDEASSNYTHCWVLIRGSSWTRHEGNQPVMIILLS